MMRDNIYLTAEHISKSYKIKLYGSRTVLKDISFEARPGTMTALIGRNGSGKSTLLKILAGVEKADGGRLGMCGYHCDFSSGSKDRGMFEKCAGYVPQENPLLEELTVKDNLKLWSGRDGFGQELLYEYGLAEILSTPVSRLSGGMKRRVSLVCALACRPDVLLLDEPTSALDIYYKKSMREYLKKHRDRGGIVIIATHDEIEIRESDVKLLLEDGAITKCT